MARFLETSGIFALALLFASIALVMDNLSQNGDLLAAVAAEDGFDGESAALSLAQLRATYHKPANKEEDFDTDFDAALAEDEAGSVALFQTSASMVKPRRKSTSVFVDAEGNVIEGSGPAARPGLRSGAATMVVSADGHVKFAM
eukprot:CAMPEP_0197644818 /NCGR_PEP_ID=MMETSP1338-20131121/17670_1 /TAXON_ID=43686 ORGANISM="Pelagodinium beii, Strain RCC1491" /NCGR_SAMPLE_ID=MMETSP1338 /ASSEMBLY_ACC=CAM_ASM_000754 /LENGTH=143 /DNA_ID=CAMNT_0043218277 /DNA_START=80 /DNA_END=511 /DNA_ORIENTATION=-